jgi:hypothetical protein
MKMNGLLIGPEDTPYEYGIFDFLMTFPMGIASSEFIVMLYRLSIEGTSVTKRRGMTNDRVISLTTNGGQTRFNPNV